jgi:hypothetical protein
VAGNGILVLSQHVNARSAIELLSAGTVGVGYLLKERVSDLAELSASVDRVGLGGSVLHPEVVNQLIGRPRSSRDPLERLTAGSARSWRSWPKAVPTRPSPQSLFVSDDTVEKHVKSIFGTLQLSQWPDDHHRVGCPHVPQLALILGTMGVRRRPVHPDARGPTARYLHCVELHILIHASRLEDDATVMFWGVFTGRCSVREAAGCERLVEQSSSRGGGGEQGTLPSFGIRHQP